MWYGISLEILTELNHHHQNLEKLAYALREEWPTMAQEFIRAVLRTKWNGPSSDWKNITDTILFFNYN